MTDGPVMIRPLRSGDVEQLVQLSLATWAPVFRSFEQILGPALFARMYPDGVEAQRATVEGACAKPAITTIVAEQAGVPVGFVCYRVDADAHAGEIELLAVAPDRQGQGIGTALNEHALAAMQAAGVTLAWASTGGDTSHSPARRSYEKAGFTPVPAVNYFKRLG